MKLSKLALLVALPYIFLTACVSTKETLPYFTDLKTDLADVPADGYALKIAPDDELLINVSADDAEAVSLYTIPYQHPRQRDFNTPNSASRESMLQSYRQTNLTLQPYIVDAKGFIYFPNVGKIHVAGMTLDELAGYLTNKIAQNVVDPIVNVELVNFHVNVIGEVMRPGATLVNRQRFSVLDALAAAGDLTPYGNRKNVLLIREENGQRQTHRLDLSKAETLSSPYFYLRQNDVIYVEPNVVRQKNSRIDAESQYRIQVTSVIVSAASVVASLAISLFNK